MLYGSLVYRFSSSVKFCALDELHDQTKKFRLLSVKDSPPQAKQWCRRPHWMISKSVQLLDETQEYFLELQVCLPNQDALTRTLFAALVLPTFH
jgi:hypothetical protein